MVISNFRCQKSPKNTKLYRNQLMKSYSLICCLLHVLHILKGRLFNSFAVLSTDVPQLVYVW